MKFKLFILPLCLIVINAFGFEGTIRQVYKNYNGTGSDVTMIWYLSAHSCRVDMTASDKDAKANTVLIMDPGSKILKTYDANASGQKQYFQVNAASITGSLSNVSSTPTQDTRQIQGHKCEKWIVSTSASSYSVWITRDIDVDWASYKDFFKNSAEIQALAQQGVKGFPMLTEAAVSSGASSVESISVQAIPATTFAIPSDYTLFVAQSQAAAKTR